jgi:hypothetical protein
LGDKAQKKISPNMRHHLICVSKHPIRTDQHLISSAEREANHNTNWVNKTDWVNLICNLIRYSRFTVQ